MRKLFRRFVCLTCMTALLVSSSGALSLQASDPDSDNYATSSSDHTSTPSLSDQHIHLGASGQSCNHGCHAVSHFLGSFAAVLESVVHIPDAFEKLPADAPVFSILSHTIFKPPRF